MTCLKDTHTRGRCQEEKLLFKNRNLGLHAHLLVCILYLTIKYDSVQFKSIPLI